jgi:YD repeat-containing protein
MTSGSAKTTYAYDPAGNLSSAVLPDGVTESRTYNDNGQLTGIADAKGSTTLDADALTLNADGQPAQASITQNGTAQSPGITPTIPPGAWPAPARPRPRPQPARRPPAVPSLARTASRYDISSGTCDGAAASRSAM